jgi:hypothetical protein
VAAWREALLAQKVLAGGTKGYRHHPQLLRFQAHANPLATIANFLAGLSAEALARGYCFDAAKIQAQPCVETISETRGQLLYEWEHLRMKLRTRAPDWAGRFETLARPQPHPLFRIVAGGVQDWEKL